VAQGPEGGRLLEAGDRQYVSSAADGGPRRPPSKRWISCNDSPRCKPSRKAGARVGSQRCIRCRPARSIGKPLPTWILMMVLLVGFIVLPAQVAEEKEKQWLLGWMQTPVREIEWLGAKLTYGLVLMLVSVAALQAMGGGLSWAEGARCLLMLLRGRILLRLPGDLSRTSVPQPSQRKNAGCPVLFAAAAARRAGRYVAGNEGRCALDPVVPVGGTDSGHAAGGQRPGRPCAGGAPPRGHWPGGGAGVLPIGQEALADVAGSSVGGPT
jgi:hypothetical protein